GLGNQPELLPSGFRFAAVKPDLESRVRLARIVQQCGARHDLAVVVGQPEAPCEGFYPGLHTPAMILQRSEAIRTEEGVSFIIGRGFLVRIAGVGVIRMRSSLLSDEYDTGPVRVLDSFGVP